MKWILIFLCLPAFGQLPVLPFAPAVTASVPGPKSISGIRYWWVSSDLTTNTAVTNWVDRIVSSIYTNGAPTLQPTNSATGVGFKGATSLTNIVPYSFPSGLTANGPYTMFLILNPHAAVGTFGAMLGNTGRGMYDNTTPALVAFGGNGNLNPMTGTLQNDKVIDFAVTGPDNISNDTFYTNGVSFLTASCFDSGTYGTIMGNDNSAHFYNGKIIEIIFYTNALSAANILTLHKYATNTYSTFPWQ